MRHLRNVWQALLAGAVAGAVLLAALSPWSTADAATASSPEPGSLLYVLEDGLGLNLSFRRCLGIGSTSEVISYRDGSSPDRTVKLAGDSSVELTCTRLLSAQRDAADWRKQVDDGNLAAAKRNVTLRALDATGVAVARWNISGAWPSEVVVVDGHELVTVVADGLARVAP